MNHKKWLKLSPEEQKIKVAELCGWKFVTNHPTRENHWVRPSDPTFPISQEVVLQWMPDYLNDLNAMHEAERAYFRARTCEDPYLRYRRKLIEVVGGDLIDAITATAAQRAEAFVCTLEPEEVKSGWIEEH